MQLDQEDSVIGSEPPGRRATEPSRDTTMSIVIVTVICIDLHRLLHHRLALSPRLASPRLVLNTLRADSMGAALLKTRFRGSMASELASEGGTKRAITQCVSAVFTSPRPCPAFAIDNQRRIPNLRKVLDA